MRKFILTLAWCGLFAGTLAAETTFSVRCFYNLRGNASSGSDWKTVSADEIAPNSAVFGDGSRSTNEVNFVANPPAGHTVSGWYWIATWR